MVMVPGVCGVVPGSVDPKLTGVEAGLSAVGDIFDAIARRAGSSAAELSKEIAGYRAGQSGLLRLTLRADCSERRMPVTTIAFSPVPPAAAGLCGASAFCDGVPGFCCAVAPGFGGTG